MENYKDIEVKGRKWRIAKFDAKTGSYMLFKLMGILAPILDGFGLGNMQDLLNKNKEDLKPEDIKIEKINFTNIVSGLTKLPEEDFNYIQGKCLNVCKEILPSGFTDVINPNGTFGVMDVEFDTMLILALTVHVLIFNVTGFFDGSPLDSFVGTILNTFQQNTQM